MQRCLREECGRGREESLKEEQALGAARSRRQRSSAAAAGLGRGGMNAFI